MGSHWLSSNRIEPIWEKSTRIRPRAGLKHWPSTPQWTRITIIRRLSQTPAKSGCARTNSDTQPPAFTYTSRPNPKIASKTCSTSQFQIHETQLVQAPPTIWNLPKQLFSWQKTSQLGPIWMKNASQWSKRCRIVPRKKSAPAHTSRTQTSTWLENLRRRIVWKVLAMASHRRLNEA